MLKLIFAYNPFDLMSVVCNQRLKKEDLKNHQLEMINISKNEQAIDDLNLEFNQTLIAIDTQTDKELIRLERPFESYQVYELVIKAEKILKGIKL